MSPEIAPETRARKPPLRGVTALSLEFDRRSAKVFLLIPMMFSVGLGISCLLPHPARSLVADVTAIPFPNSNSVIQSSPSPDFSVTASPNNIIQNGANFNSQIQVGSLNGFTGNVDLTVLTNSTSFSCSLSPKTIAGGSGYSYLSCNSSSSGTYLATVTGTSGTLSHSTTVTEYYPPSSAGFVIQASPTNITDIVGDTSSITRISYVIVVPLITFQSGVTLTVSANSTSLSCNLDPNTYFPGGTGGSTGLWCTANAPGNYVANVTAIGGTISHSATVIYHIQDFSLITGPVTLTVDTGASAATTISLVPVNGFDLNVTLSLTTSSPNLYCSLSRTSVSGGSGSATLSCNSSFAGNYVAYVTTSGGNRTQRLAFSYHVQNPSIFGVSPTEFYSALGIAIAAILVAAFLLMWRRRSRKPSIDVRGSPTS